MFLELVGADSRYRCRVSVHDGQLIPINELNVKKAELHIEDLLGT